MSSGGNSIHALCHPDFLRLEEELCRLVDGLRGKNIPNVLVFTATARQQRRVQHVLARRFGGLLGVDVLTHYTYARRLTDGAGWRDVSPVLQETVLRYLLEETEQLPLTRYLQDFPSAVSRLGTLFDELREALVPPDVLAESGGDPGIAALYSAYTRALSNLKGLDHPFLDIAGRTALATAFAPRQPTADAVFQFGVHELVAMNLQLIRAVPCSSPIQWLAPVDGQAPAWEYARLRLNEIADQVTSLEDSKSRDFTEAARCFFDWERPAVSLAEDRVQLLDAQGPEAETETVARQILADVSDRGLDFADVAVVTRNLEAYAPSLESVFRRLNIPVNSSLKTPLGREPQALTFLLLLKALESDLDRQAVMDYARSPAVPWKYREQEGWTPDWWESWSRTARLIRGSEAWLDMAEEMKNRRRTTDGDEVEENEAGTKGITPLHASAEALKSFIRDLQRAREAWMKTRRTDALVELLHTWRATWIEGDSEELRVAVEALRDLDVATQTLWAKRHELIPGELLKQIKRLFREPSVPWSQPGGVAVLDLMQARGLVFRKVYWLGFNAEWIPKRAGEDPFLGDATRRRLRKKTGLPLSTPGEAEREERLLFAQTVLSAQDHLQISWQRADAEGRSMAPSLYLGQIRRMCKNDSRVPTHPKALSEWHWENTGLLSPEEGALLSTWGTGKHRPRAMSAYVAALGKEHLTPHVNFAAVTDDAAGTDFSFDAVISLTGSWAERFSPSSLEKLGRCPHQYFFARVLGILPLRDQADESGVDTLDMGLLVHRVLERAYPEIAGGKDPGSALEREFDKAFAPVRKRMTARFPLGWEAFRSMWLRELAAFAEKDWERLHKGQWEFVQGEMKLEQQVTFENLDTAFLPESVTFTLRGQLDRLVRKSEGEQLVSDYKTSGNLEKAVDAKEALRGRRLQLSLYEILAREGENRPEVELLGVGPSFQPDKGFLNSGPQTLDPKLQQKAVEETVALLVQLTRHGRFPIHEDHHCTYCDFANACRRGHVPTKNRLDESELFDTYRRCQKKTKAGQYLAGSKGSKA